MWSRNHYHYRLEFGNHLPRQALPFRIFNNYGPTENTVVTTWCPVDVDTETDSAPPIGRPIDNTQVYVLDPHLNPVPIGVAGELCIGGDGLARGYLNQPELSAEKFIRNPFSTGAGAQLYKTGDLVRYLADGNIEFLGRIDDQVKVRGFRIELGEIETVLCQYPGVQESVVLAREDTPGDKRLVAYVIPDGGSATLAPELRGFLRQKLPDYMIPSAFMTLEAMPLTPNGKVDRRALPAPDQTRPELEEAYVAPRTEAERTIAAVWQEALQVEKVGLHDNFFDLGGYSLLVVLVHSKLREAFNEEVSTLDLFKYPTVSALAKYVIQEKNEEAFFPQSHDSVEKLKEGRDRLRQLHQLRHPN